MRLTSWCIGAVLMAAGAPLAACSSTSAGAGGNATTASHAASSGSTSASTSGGTGGVDVGTAQTPPQGGTNVEAWLAKGDYKNWTCEPAIHAARSPSPHGFNKICSNTAISSNATGTGAWPVGAAAVKEIYNALTDTTPVGYAVYLKTEDDTTALGAAWYWYERVPLSSPAPHDANGVVADGLGGSGTPMSICVACHAATGTDAAHTPSVGGRDEVYTPVH